MKLSTIFFTVLFLAGFLACNENNKERQTGQVLVKDSLKTAHYQAEISIRPLNDTGSNEENNILSHTRKGGESEGDRMYQLVGDLSYIADKLSGYQIRTPEKEVLHTVSLDFSFPTKEAKDSYLSTALDSSFNHLLQYYECEPAGDIQQSALTLSLSEEEQFNQTNDKITDQLIRDEFASEGVVDKASVTKNEMVFYKTDATEILQTLNQTTDTLVYAIAPDDPLEDRKLSLKITAPFSEEKINNLFTGYGITFSRNSQKLAVKTCRLDPESSDDLEDVHYLRMLK